MSYPTMRGKPWSVEEETALLEELASGMTIADIASRHNRTTGGIDGRRAEIAYKMHINLIPIDQICEKTGLDDVYIREMIRHKDNANAKKPATSRSLPATAGGSAAIGGTSAIDKEITALKKEMRETKAMVEEILGILKAVYEVSEE